MSVSLLGRKSCRARDLPIRKKRPLFGKLVFGQRLANCGAFLLQMSSTVLHSELRFLRLVGDSAEIQALYLARRAGKASMGPSSSKRAF